MDILASLNVDGLPEQQTRMMHLFKDYPDFQFRLGFDACCNCGNQVDSTNEITCLACKRVKYCSNECRQKDSTASTDSYDSNTLDEGDEPESAQGHTPIVCALLQTCNDDEDVEDGLGSDLSASRRQAALDRIRSEYESYPASLANILVEGPCFQDILKKCGSTLTLHIIGASEEAELASRRQGDGVDKVSRFQDYAEALSNLVASYKSIQSIKLYFIGPECPTSNVELSIPIPESGYQQKSSTLFVRTIQGIYSTELLDANSVTVPSIVVFFNPGFTVPEYDQWTLSLKTIPIGTPFLSTTNTEMEGIADCQYLLDQDRIQAIPPALAEMFGLYSAPENENDDDATSNTSIFTENPFCGSRVRQSGTMGNDLFVKNRWMLMGILDSFDSSGAKADSISKKAKLSSNNNSKNDNPALI